MPQRFYFSLLCKVQSEAIIWLISPFSGVLESVPFLLLFWLRDYLLHLLLQYATKLLLTDYRIVRFVSSTSAGFTWMAKIKRPLPSFHAALTLRAIHSVSFVILVKYILSAPFREMKKARSLLQNFGQLNAKTADKFLVTCLPFEAVILLYGSSILSAKQKQPFYIYEYAS